MSNIDNNEPNNTTPNPLETYHEPTQPQPPQPEPGTQNGSTSIRDNHYDQQYRSSGEQPHMEPPAYGLHNQGNSNLLGNQHPQYPGYNNAANMPAGNNYGIFSTSPAAPTPYVPVWLTVVVTLCGIFFGAWIFGAVGAIPAYFGEKGWAERGLPQGKHWKAFGWTMAITAIIGIILGILFFFLIFSAAMFSTGSASWG